MGTPYPKRWLAVALSLPGVAAIFLPFSKGIMPVSALMSYGGLIDLSLYAVPSLLAIPILGWQVYRLAGHPPKLSGTIAALVLAAAAMLPVLGISMSELYESLDQYSLAEFNKIWPFALCVGAVAANVAILVFNLKRRIARSAAAEIFLIGAYLPNALYCLMIFGHDYGLNIGGYVVMLACLAYVTAIALRLVELPPGSASTSRPVTGAAVTTNQSN